MYECKYVGLDDVPMKTRPSVGAEARKKALEMDEVIGTGLKHEKTIAAACFASNLVRRKLNEIAARSTLTLCGL